MDTENTLAKAEEATKAEELAKSDARSELDAWFDGAIKGGPIARDTSRYNTIFAAYRRLRDLIQEA